MIKKDIVAGIGEIGKPILRLISDATLAAGYDVNTRLINEEKLEKLHKFQTRFLHICIPFNSRFVSNVMELIKKFNPESVVIHSTIKPGTTNELQQKLPIPVIYSATRGVHKRMLHDLRRYVKFYAIVPDAPRSKWASKTFSELLNNCKVKTKKMSNPLTLEIAKIVVDTSYYGWLINYAQLSNMIAIKNKIDYDEMWSFADEIHKFLGNRPKMFPGYIGGHCVIPNLKLVNDSALNLIKEINDDYAKVLHNRRINTDL